MKQDPPHQSTVYGWSGLIGILLVLAGLYGSVRTAVNLLLFPKYPSTGAFTLNFSGVAFYGPREEDCEMSYFGSSEISIVPDAESEILREVSIAPDAESETLSQVSIPPEAKTEIPGEETKNINNQERMMQSCLKGVSETRQQVKINDISQSVMFLVLGGGILATRKYL